MLNKISIVALVGLLLSAQAAIADAPLKSRLALDTDQAKIVTNIQAKHREAKRGERQSLNREARKLRRARNANDSELIAKQEIVVSRLEDVLRQRILSEDDEIRQVLNPDQLKKFEHYLVERNNMTGSSRDVLVLKR